jgi:hypothetical protein
MWNEAIVFQLLSQHSSRENEENHESMLGKPPNRGEKLSDWARRISVEVSAEHPVNRMLVPQDTMCDCQPFWCTWKGTSTSVLQQIRVLFYENRLMCVHVFMYQNRSSKSDVGSTGYNVWLSTVVVYLKRNVYQCASTDPCVVLREPVHVCSRFRVPEPVHILVHLSLLTCRCAWTASCWCSWTGSWFDILEPVHGPVYLNTSCIGVVEPVDVLIYLNRFMGWCTLTAHVLA